MELLVILAVSEAETAWGALRLVRQVQNTNGEAAIFLLGKGVEAIELVGKQFNVRDLLIEFVVKGGMVFACGTCLDLRGGNTPEIYQRSTMGELQELIAAADKVVSF